MSSLWDKWTGLWGRADKALGLPNATNDRKAAMKQDQRLMNEQIKAYRDQSEITRNEINAKRGEAVAEKRKIEEKQIRSLRRNYRASGFLGASQSEASDMSSTLGG